jgi:hypothetical protein
MNAINAMSGAAIARPDIKNARAGASKSKMFGMPATAAGKTTKTPSAGAGTANGAADLATSNGAKAATQSPAAPVANNLLPAPASTVDFAQKREGAAYHAHSAHGSGASANESTESAGAASSTASTTAALDPLDTNGDGAVSSEERVAGDLESLMKDMAAMNGASDAGTSPVATNTGNNDLQSAADKIKSDFGSFVDSVLKQYAQTASASASGYSSGIAATA